GTVIEIETEESLPEGATLMEDAVATEDAPAWAAALMAGLMDLKARVDGMAPAATMGNTKMEDASLMAPIAAPAPVVPSAPVQMGDMARRLAQLEQRAVIAEVDALIGERDFRGLTREKLLQIRMSDPTTFKGLVELAPRRLGGSARTAASGVAMSDEQRLFTAEGVAQLRQRHTVAGKFDAASYHKEWRDIRGRLTLSPTGGAA
ncbi:MAG TPA: hypothetical protein VLA31_00300, partial [Burkholderiaceae bacterium]|nr:hypothetical protein [Burkholderiaceae bacterium]